MICDSCLSANHADGLAPLCHLAAHRAESRKATHVYRVGPTMPEHFACASCAEEWIANGATIVHPLEVPR